MAGVTLSIIIVSYNVRDFLEQCLRSVLRSASGIETEIFVVDNLSADGTRAMLHSHFPSHTYPFIHCIFNETNVGFSRANNQALKLAKGKYILVLNPDTLLSEDTLSKMISFMERPDMKDVGAAGCKLLNADGTFQLSCRRGFPSPEVSFYKLIGLARLFPKHPRFARYHLTYLSEDDTYEIDALMGAFMFLRREILASVGLFDETFFMYGEDLDWCYRIKANGWKIMYYPETQIIHYKGESTKTQSFNYVVQFYEAMVIFVRKYYASSGWLIWVLMVGIYSRASLSVLSRFLKWLFYPLSDMILLTISIFIGFYFKFYVLQDGGYPDEFLWLVLPTYLAIWMLTGFLGGVYHPERRLSLKALWTYLTAGFFLSATLTFFFKQYAFSRVGLALSFANALLLLTLLRLFVKVITNNERGGFFPERRCVIIGSSTVSETLYQRLRALPHVRYHVIGFIDSEAPLSSSLWQAGDSHLSPLLHLGALSQLSEIIRVNRISDIIVAPGAISTSTLLSVISRLKSPTVEFRLVSENSGVMIGKGAVEPLHAELLGVDEVDMTTIEYNLLRPENRLSKRLFDLALLPLCILLSPFLWLMGKRTIFSGLYAVAVGRMTLVGASSSDGQLSENGFFVGKKGLWSLAALSRKEGKDAEAVDVFYAKQSTRLFDLEILLKSFFKP